MSFSWPRQLIWASLSFILTGCFGYEPLVSIPRGLGTATVDPYSFEIHQPSIHLFDPVSVTQKASARNLQQRVQNIFIILPPMQDSREYRGVPYGMYVREIFRRFNRTLPHVKLSGGVWTLTEQSSDLSISPYLPMQIENALDRGVELASIGTADLAQAIQAVSEMSSKTQGIDALILFSPWEDLDEDAIEAVDRFWQRGHFDSGFNIIPANSAWDGTNGGSCAFVVGLGNNYSRSQLDRVDECGFSVASDRIADPSAMAEFVERVIYAGPKDSDSDGVYDYLDLCPGVGAGRIVDADGCLRFVDRGNVQ